MAHCCTASMKLHVRSQRQREYASILISQSKYLSTWCYSIALNKRNLLPVVKGNKQIRKKSRAYREKQHQWNRCDRFRFRRCYRTLFSRFGWTEWIEPSQTDPVTLSRIFSLLTFCRESKINLSFFSTEAHTNSS